MPLSYWSYAFATAAYLINRLPTPVLDMKSPFFKLFGEHPNYGKLRTFDSLWFPWLRPYTQNKLENWSTPCVFLGYLLTQSAYICFHPSSVIIYVSKHVKLDESSFPFSTLSQTYSSSSNTTASSFFPPVETIHVPLPHVQQPSSVTPQVHPTLDSHQSVLQESVQHGTSATEPAPREPQKTRNIPTSIPNL